MNHTQYHSDMDNTAACMGRTGQDIGVTGRTDPNSWGEHPACLDGQSAPLQTVAAGIFGGASPLQFMAGIDAGSRQMGNRAFLHWIGELYAAGRGGEAHEATVQGSQAPGRPQTRLAPLQLMPKKKKKKGEPAGAEVAGTLSEAPPEAGAATVPEPQATVPQAEPGATATPGEKKKKKSRVQVALNALRADGVEEFGRYIHAEIGETALLQTLTERITRAQDLGVRQKAALRTVEERMRRLDPEHAVPAVPTAPQAAVAGQRQVAEKAAVAPVKASLSKREQDLLKCCFEGNAGRFKHLVRHRTVDINMGSEYGTFLCSAAFMDNTVIVKELLSIPGIDVNLAHQTGGTPLCFAAQQGSLEVVKLLLAAPGINVNMARSEGTTPLSMAAQNGHEEVVKLLLAAPDINCDARKDNGATPLVVAVQMNHTRVVEQLIKSGADVNLIIDEDGLTALCIAVTRKNLGVLKLLLQVPCIQVNCGTGSWVNPLSSASYQGYKDIVKLLLEKGADPNIAHENGIAPLHLACLRGHTDIIKILLDAGADMDGKIVVPSAEVVTVRFTPHEITELLDHREMMTLLEQHRQARTVQAVQVETLSPCLRPAEPAPLLTTAGAGSAKAGGQAPEDEPCRLSPSTALPEPASLPATTPVTQAEHARLTPSVAAESRATGGLEPADRALPSASPEPIVSGNRPASAEPRTPLALGKQELVQEILRKLERDNLEPLEGIRLLVEVRASASIDGFVRDL